MNRRTFLQVSTTAGIAAELQAYADSPMPTGMLGKTGLRVSRITLGGHHMRVRGEEGGIQIIQRAIDLGINMLDSAHKYNRGESEITYGKALKGGLRQKVLLMSKAHLRDREGAMGQLEETLKRMGTDYLDVWQCHEVSTHEEVDKIFGPAGAMEAFVKAKQQGKARFIGFTGHRDPSVHLRLLDGYGSWDTVQHPVNLIDPHYLSFINTVLPKVRQRGLGVFGMKSNAIGNITKNKIASIPECLRFALSQDIDTLVSGMTTVQELEENVATVKAFSKMPKADQDKILSRTKGGIYGSKVEDYKKPEAGAAIRLHNDGDFA